ncbi:hypothetical protein PPACK8108_LOCUS4190 [Phakopsora pachyrhizi]|uniref:RING-type domain-containing protein n=1 Tax=Phakopsora pachyrhizi TaxID=170000 RepID=A0AAV0AP62_PHAPC|nr:hypothetical protein PPACK8108_LOCUS4190 [Phakopsora pachyrhizi]
MSYSEASSSNVPVSSLRTEKTDLKEHVRRFVDQCGYMYPDEARISKTLICAICSEPWSDPVITSPCGHVFCSGCIKTWLRHVSSCPNDRRILSSQDIVPAPRILRELVDELVVICSLGCGWEGRRDDWKAHLETNCAESDRIRSMVTGVRVQIDSHGDVDPITDLGEEETFRQRWKKLACEVHTLKKELKEQAEVIEKWKDKVSKRFHLFFFGGGGGSLGKKLQLQLKQVAESPETDEVSTPATGRDIFHPANCDFCKKIIRGIRFKCLKCPDLDSCFNCYRTINQTHPVHDFAMIRFPGDIQVVCLPEWRIAHPGVICNNCLNGVVGPRFKCVICTDYDLCHHCMALPRSPHPIGHPMTRYVNPQNRCL